MSKWDLVVQVVTRTGGSGGLRFAILLTERVSATTSRIQHRQFTPESIQDDLCRVFLDARLIRPFPSLQLAFKIDFRALAEIFLGNFPELLIEYYDAMPFGSFPALTGCPVAPRF